MEHTPGPWEVSQYCEGGAGAQLGVKGYDRPVYWNYRIYRNETDVEAKANARLIAAAPDLLSALTDLVCCPVFTGKCFESDPETHKAWTLAREAINKATK